MLARAFGVLAVATLAGCVSSTSTSDIAVKDTGTFIPSGRLSFDLAPRGERPSVPHSGHGIEIGVTGASGDDQQRIDPGARPIVIGGQTFAAPNNLNYEFDFRYGELAYRFRHFFGAGSFGIEALGGLGIASYELAVSSATQRANDKLDSLGLVGGFGLVWKFLPATSLQSRVTVFASGETEGVTSAMRLDAFVSQAIGRHAALRAGVTGWALDSVRDEDGGSINSQIRARFSGVALGLDVAF